MENKEQFAARKNDAYDLRLRGKSYRQISAELGISVGTAHRWVAEVTELVILPNVEEVRKHEVDRLMRYLDKLDARIEEGDDKAIGLAVKVSEALRRMLGVDMPTQHIVEQRETTQTDLAILDLINSQKAKSELRKSEAVSRRPIDDGGSETFTESDVLSSDIESIVLEN